MSGERLHLHFFWDEALPNRFAAGIQILRTGAAFARRGQRFTCHCRAFEGDGPAVLAHYGAQAEGAALEAFPLPIRGGRLGDWMLQRRLLRWIAALPQDERHAIVVRGATAVRMSGALAALALSPRRSRPLVLLEMHNLHFLREAEKRLGRSIDPDRLDERRIKALKDAEIRLIAAADGLICLTEPVRASAARLLPDLPPSLLLPSGTDLPSPAARPEPRWDVVYAGKIEPRKGVADLVAAMPSLPERTLALAGGPDEAVPALAGTAEKLGVSGRVTFAGLLPPQAVEHFLLSGRVGACPLPRGIDTVSESFTSPMKLIQMMALGLPVVATDVPPVRALVTDGVDGLFARPNEPASLAAAIARLLDNPAFASRLGEAARRRVADFTWERRAEKLDGFLLSLVAR